MTPLLPEGYGAVFQHIVGPLLGGLSLVLLSILVWRHMLPRKERSPTQLDEPADEDERDRRRATRHPIVPVPILVSGRPLRSVATPAEVRDRSRGGLGLHSLEGYDEGTLLNIWELNSLEEAPALTVEVRYCFRKGGGWVLGCQFIAPPSRSQLRFLG